MWSNWWKTQPVINFSINVWTRKLVLLIDRVQSFASEFSKKICTALMNILVKN